LDLLKKNVNIVEPYTSVENNNSKNW